MVSRKSHPKSRNGCGQCKKRRIKCDEVAPRCNNCTKHDIECDFTLDPLKRQSASPNAARKRSVVSTPSEAKSDIIRSPDASPATAGSSLAPLHMDELELLHHFTTETCFTLSDRPESHVLWQVTIPQEAFKHDFLMRGIMAISASHLSFKGGGGQDYWTRIAVQQQDAAIRTFRDLVGKMDESNCDALFALSTLIVVYGFDFPKSADSMGLFNYKGDQQSDDWIPLIRGVSSLIMSLWPHIKAGRLSGLLHDHKQEAPQQQMPAVLDQQLENLVRFCDSAPGGADEADVYKRAVGALRDCFARMNNKQPYECEVSLAFLWPVMVPQEFIPKMNAREPHALIILAHYCVILNHLDGYWWMSGWAMHIVHNIHRQLDDSKRLWLQWPANVIGVDGQLLTNGALQNPIQGTRVRSDFDTRIDQSLAIPHPESMALDDDATAPKADDL